MTGKLTLELSKYEENKINEIKELHSFLAKQSIFYELYVWLEDFIESYEEKPNKVSILAKCGQKMEIALSEIDKNQEIGEVVIRGVKYVRES